MWRHCFANLKLLIKTLISNIKYDSEYLMIDLASNWIVFFSFINWLIPKTYVKITKNDYEKLNIVKPVKNKSIGWTISCIVLLGGTVKKKYLFI